MGKLFILLNSIIAFTKIISAGFVIFMLVQLISYRIFGFNPYKTALRFIKKEIRI
jgi:hypothetical protein